MTRRTQTHWLASVDVTDVRWRLEELAFERQRRGDDDPMTWHRKFEGTTVKRGPLRWPKHVPLSTTRAIAKLRAMRSR